MSNTLKDRGEVTFINTVTNLDSLFRVFDRIDDSIDLSHHILDVDLNAHSLPERPVASDGSDITPGSQISTRFYFAEQTEKALKRANHVWARIKVLNSKLNGMPVADEEKRTI